MSLVFYSNYLNHHQAPVADELYSLLGDEFRFVATLSRNEKELKGGEDYSKRHYCIFAAESNSAHDEARSLAVKAEICVFGACSQEFAVERAKNNPHGLSFEMGERWMKHGLLTIGSPVFREWVWNYYRYFRKANFYKLCCSSFTASDDERLNAYKGKHYKWGYFTRVDDTFVNEISPQITTKGKVRILWCARFLMFKHPELVIKLASRLKKKGYVFSIDLYGDEGHLAPHDKKYPRESLESLIKKLGVKDVVTLMSSLPNSEILKVMQGCDIFIFTSDRLEGWGAVANEAMANGCVLVASDAIGSTGYLVKHKETGMVFRSNDIESLYEQVKFLLDNPDERKRIAVAGQQTMMELWNPSIAAKNLLQLIEDIKAGRDSSIVEGPCSKA